MEKMLGETAGFSASFNADLVITLKEEQDTVRRGDQRLLRDGEEGEICDQSLDPGTSLVVQWLRLCTPSAGLGSSPVRELDPTCCN